MGTSIHFSCPFCQGKLKAPGRLVGKPFICPKCGMTSVVSALPRPVSEEPPKLPRKTNEFPRKTNEFHTDQPSPPWLAAASPQAKDTGPFTIEQNLALDLLKQQGWVRADKLPPEQERVFADIATAGLARKQGNAYFHTGNSPAAKVKRPWRSVMLIAILQKIIWAGISRVPQLIACVMLLWALKPNNPYGYYILLRWVCCAVFVYLAFQALLHNKQGWFWVLGITAVIYNPIIRVHLTREIWQLINVVTIGIAVATIFSVKVRHEKDHTAPSEAKKEGPVS